MTKGVGSGDAATAHDGMRHGQASTPGPAAVSATAVDGMRRGGGRPQTTPLQGGSPTRVVGATREDGVTRGVSMAQGGGAAGGGVTRGVGMAHGGGAAGGDAAASLSDGMGDETDPLIGATLVESYRVLRVLGEGGMGRVYEAQHTRIQGKRYALKVLHPEFAQHDDVRARFHREAEAAATINHTNVVGVFDVNFLPDGRPFLVSELLHGYELGDYIAEQGQLPVALAVAIVRQMCAGLQAAHDRGVVHRDVKPANVFLTGNPELPHVKVLDFGISRLDGQEGRQLTQIGMVMGTPSYMPPEQARGEQVDSRADVYSAGAVLYRALSARRPFQHQESNTIALMSAVLTQDPAPLRLYANHVPVELEEVVQRAMAREPDDRYQHMRELSDALAPFDPLTASLSQSNPQLMAPMSRQQTPHSSLSLHGSSPAAPAAMLTRQVGAGQQAAGSHTPNSQLSIMQPASHASTPQPAASRPAASQPSESSMAAYRPSRPTDDGLRRLFMIGGGVGLVAVLAVGSFMFIRSAERQAATAAADAKAAASAPANVGSTTAGNAGSKPSGSGATPSTKPAAKPAGPPINADALVIQLSNQHHKRDIAGSIETLGKLGRGAPQKVMDPNVRKLAGDVTVRAFLEGGRHKERITELLSGEMGGEGLDILFDMMVTRGGSKAASGAKTILGRPDVRERCIPDLRLAYDLRVSKSCGDKIALIPRASKEGGSRTLRELKIMRMCSGTGCCLSKHRGLHEAMRTITRRIQ